MDTLGDGRRFAVVHDGEDSRTVELSFPALGPQCWKARPVSSALM